MRPQLDFRRHAHKVNVTSIVFTGTDVVEHLIVFLHQTLPALGVVKNPLLKRLVQRLLLLLGNHGFFLVQDALFFPVLILDVVDFHVPLVQVGLKDRVGTDTGRAVGHAGQFVFILTFALDIPLAADG